MKDFVMGPPTPDYTDHTSPVQHMRPSKELLLPMAESESDDDNVVYMVFERSDNFRPDGRAMRVLRTMLYVLGIITCLAVLYVTYDVYSTLHDIRDSISIWVNGFNTTGIFGN